MKIHLILIFLLCFKIELSDEQEIDELINLETFNETFIKSLPIIKTFQSFSITDEGNFSDIRVSFPSLAFENIKINFESSEILNISFVNLSPNIKGSIHYKIDNSFSYYKTIKATLEYFTLEEKVKIKKSQLSSEKLKLNYKYLEQPKISYRVKSLDFMNNSNSEILSEFVDLIEPYIKQNLIRILNVILDSIIIDIKY